MRVIDGSGAGGFSRPGGVAVDGDGRIAVADTLNHRVVLLNPNGSVLGVIDTPGMDDPESVAFGPDGKLYVSDTYNDRVRVYASMGGGAAASDTTAPNGTVSVPSNDQTLSGIPAQLSGGATDDLAVGAVRIAIKDRVTGQWLRAGGWGAFMNHDATLSDPGGASTNWTYPFAPPTGGSGQYALQVTAVDAANNADPTKPWVPFQLNA